MKNPAQLIAAAGLLFFVTSSHACIDERGQEQCPPDTIPIGILGVDEGGIDACKIECPDPTDSLPDPQLHCLSDGRQHACEAWPQGPFLHYSWNAEWALELDLPTDGFSPIQVFTCPTGSDGRIFLVGLDVHRPNGSSASRIFSLLCEGVDGAVLFPLLPDPEQSAEG